MTEKSSIRIIAENYPYSNRISMNDNEIDNFILELLDIINLKYHTLSSDGFSVSVGVYFYFIYYDYGKEVARDFLNAVLEGYHRELGDKFYNYSGPTSNVKNQEIMLSVYNSQTKRNL